MTHRQVSRIALNRNEVALSIGVSANTVDLMVLEGALPHPRKWHTRKLRLVSEIAATTMEWPNDAPPQEDDDEDWRVSV